MVAINEQLIADGDSTAVAQTLSKLDLVSIEALIAYTAHRVKAEEPFIRRAVLVHFNIDDLKELPRTKRNTAIKFLVNYRVAANSR